MIALVLCAPVLADRYDDAEATFQAGDFKRAVREWKALADAGDARAQYRLGVLHELGQGVTACNAGAFDWYLRSARNGDWNAQRAVARMYSQGLGVRRDSLEAQKWEHIAAANPATRVQLAESRTE